MTHFVLDARTVEPHFPGIGRYVTNLARELVPHLRDNERLTLIGPASLPTEIAPTCRVRALALPDSAFSLRQQWSVPRVLSSLGADLYHSPYYLMPYRPGVTTLLTTYDLISIHYPELASARARLLFRSATRLALRAAQRVIAISEATRLDYIAHFPDAAARTITIPLAAAASFAPPSATAINSVRERYSLPERFVLYLGSNKAHKNLARLVECWQLAERGPTILALGGQWNPHDRAVEQLVGRLNLADSVRFLGPIDEADLPALYGAAELFAFPSLYEGFGLPVLESMACGTPVICSDRSSLPEVAGSAARLFDPTDVPAMAAAVSELLADSSARLKLRELGMARAAEFSWERTALAHLALYRALSDEGWRTGGTTDPRRSP